MAYLRLYLGEAHVHLALGKMLSSGLSVSWDVRMGWDESVELSSGGDLAKMPGALHLQGGEFHQKPDAEIGTLNFLPARAASDNGVIDAAPARFSVEIVVPEERLKKLLQMTRDWVGGIVVSVSVPDLKYGWAPDGSIKRWEVQKDEEWASLAVDGFSFSFSPPQKDDAEEPTPPTDEPSALPSEALALEALRADIKRALAWMLVGLLVLIIVVAKK